MKVCSGCKLEKSEVDFTKSKSAKDGLYHYCRNCSKLYRSKNKEKEAERHRIWWSNTKGERKKVYTEYRKNNREKYKESYTEYRRVNKELIKSRRNRVRENERHNERIKTDSLFKLKCRTKTLITQSILKMGYSKNSKTFNILGCSFEDFKFYLESKFESWMSWDNYGLYNGELNYGWDIDHIIPSSSAKTEEELLVLNRFNNLQPLCSYQNRVIKKDKII